MNDFSIFPAVDLRQGNVVRLQYGDPARQTTFGSDPVAMAMTWISAGAPWLHVVNLDGAFDETGAANWAALPRIAALGTPVQFGGGVRSLDDIQRALDAGARRVILGTVAVENPQLVGAAVAEFGAEQIVVGIDARDGRVKTRGWQSDTHLNPEELGRQMVDQGVRTAIHTDISRDGVMTGVDAGATAALAGATGLRVVASGGVATLDDVVRLFEQRAEGIIGAVIGRALYDGRVDLADAVAATQET